MKRTLSTFGAAGSPLLGSMLALAACSGPRAAANLVAPQQLAHTEWRLDSMQGQPVSRRNVTLEFGDSTAGGYSGCNWYGLRYLPDTAAARFSGAESTARGCADSVMTIETAFHRSLARIAVIERRGSGLRMRDSSGRVLLSLRQRQPVPLDSAALRQSRWELLTDPSGEAPTLDIAGDSISGFAGCRRYSGSYLLRADHLRVTNLAMTDTECRRGGAAADRENQFISRLSEVANVVLTSDRLMLITFDGDTLTLRRR